ncbi:MAG TPA: hypothetical protein VLX90_03790, partial [Steroidobacteraceae bacterium]|nr:hypothetical protein [Steroidobacteraceae bacterium]
MPSKLAHCALSALIALGCPLSLPGAPGENQHEVLHSLSDSDLIVEDVALDPRDGSYIVSSVRQRKILRISPDGAATDLLTANQIPMWGAFA